MNNVRNIRASLVTVRDIIEPLPGDIDKIKSIVVVMEMVDGEIKSGYSEQLSSDLALKALYINDLAVRSASGEL